MTTSSSSTISSTRRARRRVHAARVGAATLAVLLVVGRSPAAKAAPTQAQPGATEVSPTAPPPAAATFGIGPANATAPDGRADFNYVVTPGSQVADDVAVVNLADAPVTLRLYATDATNQPDGTAGLLAADTPPADAGSWVHLENPDASGTITIGPRATVVVPVSITVPAGARAGDHAGGIVASLLADAKTAQGDVVHLDQRVAVRMLFRVSGQLAAQLSIEELHTSYHQSAIPWAKADVTVSYTVRNTGNVKLGASQQVQVEGFLGGTEKVDGLASIPVLLPGASVHTSVVVPGVPPALWASVKVMLVPAAATRDVDPQLSPFTRSKHVFTLPISLIAIVTALLAGGWYGRRRRRRRTSTAPTPTPRPAGRSREKVPA